MQRKRPGKQARLEDFDNSPGPQKIGETVRRLGDVESDGWVTRARVALNAIGADELASAPNDNPGNDNLRGVVRGALRDDVVSTRTIGASQVARINLAPGAAGPAELGESLFSPPQSTAGLRIIGNLLGGGAVSAASSNHAHSVSFKLLARSARRGLLVLRGRLRSGRERELEKRVQDLEGMVLGLCHLAFDDEHEVAEERERRLVEDPEYRRAWGEKMHLDFGSGEELWLMRGHHARAHEDLDEVAGMGHEMGLGRMKPGAVQRRPMPGREDLRGG